MTTSAVFEVTLLDDNQNTAEQQVNTALNRIERLAQLTVKSRTTTAPPGGESDGDAYLVPTGATGAWAGKDGLLTIYSSGYTYVRPKNGWRLYIEDEDQEVYIYAVQATVSATFADNDPAADTLTRASGSWITDGFEEGMFLTVDGSDSNDGQFTLDTLTSATVITLDSGDAVTDEGPTASVTVYGYALHETHGNVIVPTSHRVFMSPLTRDPSSAFSLVNDDAYFVYLGKTVAPVTPQYVEFLIPTGSAGTGVTINEVGLFSTPAPPNKSGQTLTKIEAGNTTVLTTTGMKRNSSAFSTEVPAGTHLWAGLHVEASGMPGTIGLMHDFSEGFVLKESGPSDFSAASSFTGSIIGNGATALCPDLRATVD